LNFPEPFKEKSKKTLPPLAVASLYASSSLALPKVVDDHTEYLREGEVG